MNESQIAGPGRYKCFGEITASKTIILGKKSYIDHLEVPVVDTLRHKDQEPEKPDFIIKDYHMRLKGIPQVCLNSNIYDQLYEGKTIKFDLLQGVAGIKINTKEQVIYQLDESFERSIKF